MRDKVEEMSRVFVWGRGYQGEERGYRGEEWSFQPLLSLGYRGEERGEPGLCRQQQREVDRRIHSRATHRASELDQGVLVKSNELIGEGNKGLRERERERERERQKVCVCV